MEARELIEKQYYTQPFMTPTDTSWESSGNVYYLSGPKYLSARNEASTIPSLQQYLQLLFESNLQYARQLFNRVLYLKSPPESHKDEEWPDVIYDSIQSFVSFFIDSNFPIPNKEPDLFLTQEGILRAEWCYDKDKFLALEFLSQNRYKYILFSPSKDISNEIDRASGYCSKTRLKELTEHFQWFK